MPRCSFPPRHMASTLALLACAWLSATPATAQTTLPAALNGQRNFPDAAARGTLVITSATTAEINGRAIRMAPGMRLFNAENGLVMLHTVLGQSFTTNYLVEQNTGMLLSAWILTKAETAAKSHASGGIAPTHNYSTGTSAQ